MEDADGGFRGGQLPFSLSGGGERTKQLARVTVTDSTGRERPELRQTVWLAGNTVTSVIPLALNGSVGQWTIVETDVVSGKSASRQVRIR